MDNKFKGTIYIIIACIIFASSGILVRLVNKELTLFSQIYFRVIVSFIITLIFVFSTHKKIELDRKDLWLFLISAAIGYVAMIVLFTIGALHTTIGNTYWLLYTTPLFVIVFAKLFFKEKFQMKYIISFIILALGMYLVFLPTLGSSYGDIAAVLSAVCYAVYIIVNRKLTTKYSSGVALLYTLGFSVVLLTLAAPFFHTQINTSFSLGTVGIIVLFGINNFIASYLLNLGIKHIGAQNASILLVFEPVFSILYSWLLFDEKLTLLHYAGFSLILIAVYVATMKFGYRIKITSKKKNHRCVIKVFIDKNTDNNTDDGG